MTGIPREGFFRLAEVLDRMEIPYMIAGSAASGIHGMAPTTRDVDLIARIRLDDADALAHALRGEFYIDPDQIRAAIRAGRSFNIIHLASSFKFDIFPAGKDRFHQTQFGRRMSATTTLFDPEPTEVTVETPEDVILSKLNRYRLGGCVSQQQWNDVLGVVAVKRGELDLAYLKEWAAYLKVEDLLERALGERQEQRY